jgi:hypothetical protein
MIKTTREVGKNEQDKKQWFDQEFEKSFIDLKKPPRKPDGVISIGYDTWNGKLKPNYIFTKGELSCISAPSKSFKSTFKSHLASAYFTGHSDQFTDLKGHREAEETLIDIDTEQGEYYAWHTFNRTQKISGMEISDYYYPFKLRHMTPTERVDFIDILLRHKVKNPALIFVDGIADLLEDTNDLVMSNEIVSKVMRWTDDLNVHVCVVIHNAYGTRKPTGHLGSSVVKKAETVININEVVDGNNESLNYFKVTHQYSRGARFEDFYFQFDNDDKILKQVNDNGVKDIF